MKKETCCECKKILKSNEETICDKCLKKWKKEDEKYSNCDECTPLGYYLSDGVYISCGSAHKLGLI